jgi:hypothetical protein
LPLPESAAHSEIARRLNYETVESFDSDLTHRMKDIREAYDGVMQSE